MLSIGKSKLRESRYTSESITRNFLIEIIIKKDFSDTADCLLVSVHKVRVPVMQSKKEKKVKLKKKL